MNRLNMLASVLAMSAASFAANGAQANCADDLAAMKAGMGSTGAEASTGATQTAEDTATSASPTPADQDQAAVNSGQDTFTESGSNDDMADGAEATGALSGIAPTPALGQVASGDSEALGDETAAGATSSTGGQSADAPANEDQAAVNSDEPTFTESGSNAEMADGGDATGALSGIAPTPALGQEAEGDDTESQSANASQSTGSSSENADMTTTASTSSGDASGTDAGETTETQLAAAQAALDRGDEQACMSALEAAQQAM